MVVRKILLAAALVVTSAAGAGAFELSSPDIAHGGTIGEKFVYNGFGCAGGDLSPALEWSDPPAGTKSFAVLMHDPDAPTGGAGFWHWVVFNIPATATGLPQGAGKHVKGKEGSGKENSGLPQGATQVATDFGAPGYGGPCPPKGDAPHRYHFTVYALNTDKIELPPNATASLAGYFINANALAKASLTATFGR